MGALRTSLVSLLMCALGCGDDAAPPDQAVPPDRGAPRDAANLDGAADGALRDQALRDGARDTGMARGDTLSARYPNDEGLRSDDGVIFFDDFEGGWGEWDRPREDTRYLSIREDEDGAYLHSRVSRDDLAEETYISAAAEIRFAEGVEHLFWRFYARFPQRAPNPHHWVRVSAGTPDFFGSGIANRRPPGDEGFWFDVDADNDDRFLFYSYWHEMRTSRCNDGSDTPGCAGDQGTTNYFGNVLRPVPQTPFPRNEWICLEIEALVNEVGERSGALALYVNGDEVGRFAPGEPSGTWLRDQFHVDGCEFSACEAPSPFEGFSFRTSDDVLFRGVVLDAYYEQGSNARKIAALEERGFTVEDENIIHYDNVVVARERIGCRVP